MKEKNNIQDVALAFVCTQNWDEMKVCADGRFCRTCQKVVYDFTDKSQEAYDTVLRQHGGQICGRFTQSQTTPSVNWAKIATLAALSLGATEGLAQKSDTLAVSTNQVHLANDKDVIFGMVIEPPAQFIGGSKAMFQFLAENIRWPSIGGACIEGTVYVGFVVESDGRLTEIKVKRGLHPLFDAEALRVVALMSEGKWKPETQNGQPVRSAFTLPIKFRLD